MPISFTPQVILQIVFLALNIFGCISAIVLFTEKSAHAILVSFVLIFLLVLDTWNLIADFPFIGLIEFLNCYIGRGIFYIIIGCLFSSQHGLRLAAWIIFWLAGIANIILNFLPISKLTPLLGQHAGVPRDNYEYPNNEYGNNNYGNNNYGNDNLSNEKADAYAPLN